MFYNYKQTLLFALSILLISTWGLPASNSSFTTQDILEILRDQDGRITDFYINFDHDQTITDEKNPTGISKRENITLMAKGGLFRTRKQVFNLEKNNEVSFDQEFSADGKTQYFCDTLDYWGSVQSALPQNCAIGESWAVSYTSCVMRVARIKGNLGFECNLIGALEEDKDITVSEELYENQKAIVLTRPGYSKIYLDPQLNFVVLGVKSIGEYIFEKKNSDFIEVEKGIWMPMHTELSYKDGSKSVVREVKVKKLKVNNGYKQEDFRIKFSPVIRVFDYNLNAYITPSSKELDSIYLGEVLKVAEEKGFIDIKHVNISDSNLSVSENSKLHPDQTDVSNYSNTECAISNKFLYLKQVIVALAIGITTLLLVSMGLKNRRKK